MIGPNVLWIKLTKIDGSGIGYVRLCQNFFCKVIFFDLGYLQDQTGLRGVGQSDTKSANFGYVLFPKKFEFFKDS